MMKIGTVALVVRYTANHPEFVEAFSSDAELARLEGAIQEGEINPLEKLHQQRDQELKEEESFGDYVENLISKPFVRPEIRRHGIEWLKSKIRIEEFQKNEGDAIRIIADHAFQLFKDHPETKEFILSGPSAMVMIHVVVLPEMTSPVLIKSSVG